MVSTLLPLLIVHAVGALAGGELVELAPGMAWLAGLVRQLSEMVLGGKHPAEDRDAVVDTRLDVQRQPVLHLGEDGSVAGSARAVEQAEVAGLLLSAVIVEIHSTRHR